MALVLADRVRDTTTTTSTGTITLSGTAPTGYQNFSVIGNGNTTYYAIVGQGTTEWEVGIGTYTSSGTTLARTTVLASSNAGSLVVFSAGTKDVFVTYPAERSVNLSSAALTSGRVPYATTNGLLTDVSGFTFDGTKLTVAGLIDSALTSGRVPYATTSGELTDSTNLTFNGTKLTAAGVIDSALTSGRVTYATTSGELTDSANLTFNGTTLTANTIGAFTLGGTVAGGGNQLNNVIIGTTTPLAGFHTTVSATTSVTTPSVTNAGTLDLAATGANILTISTNSTERVRVTSAGGVSFGATGTAYGTSGQVLTSAGNAPPTWSTPTGVTTGKSIAMAMIFGF